MPTSIFTSDSLINSEVELPEDSSVWSQKISEVLFSTHPELTSFPSSLNIDKFEPIKLYAKGTYTFDISGHVVIFPIIIQAKRLQPLDVALVDDEWRPITAEYIADLEAGAELGKDTENTSGFYTRSTPIGGTRVPYETTTALNPGVEFGNGGRYVTASVMTEDSKAKLIERIKTDPKIGEALANNKLAKKVFREIVHTELPDGGIKAAAVVRKDANTAVVSIKTASGEVLTDTKDMTNMKPFITKLAGADAYSNFIKEGCMSSIFGGRGAMSGKMMEDVAEDSEDLSTMIPEILKKLMSGGMMGSNIHGSHGSKPTMIIKIKRVHGGEPKELGALSGGGMFSHIRKSLMGSKPEMGCDSVLDNDDIATDDHDITSAGDLLPMTSDNEAIEPVRVTKVLNLPMAQVLVGETVEGGEPFTGIIMKQLDTKLASDIESMSALIPKEGRVTMPFGSILVKIAKDTDTLSSKGAVLNAIKSRVMKVSKKACLHKTGKLEYSLDGKYIIGTNNVKAALAMKGISNSVAETFIKTANVHGKVDIYVTADKVKAPEALVNKLASAADWIKLASITRDTEESVDSVLSLGLLDGKGNTGRDELLPIIDDANSKLAKLLVSARLGMPNLDQVEISDAINALQDVAKSFKM